MSRSEMRPPTITIAKGRCESEPNHSSLNGNAEQREESNARGNTEVGVCNEQRKQAADSREHDVHQD